MSTVLQAGDTDFIVVITMTSPDGSILDVSAATVRVISFRNPLTKDVISRAALLTGTGEDGKIEYTIVEDDEVFSVPGLWSVQGYVEIAELKRHSRTVQFDVLENLTESIVITSSEAVVTGNYTLVAELGGDPHGFSNPAVADEYPSGAEFNKLISGSSTLLLDRSTLGSGSIYLEVSAKLDSELGARAKVALFDLDVDPDVPLDDSEIVFSIDEIVGERMRSNAITLPIDNTEHEYGVKITTDNVLVGAAAWGCRVIKI